MPRITKAQADRERERTLQAAFNAGCEYFVGREDEDIVVVHREASARYTDKPELFSFVEGFRTRRQQRDEYLKEKGSQS